jgi:hypothetical protein
MNTEVIQPYIIDVGTITDCNRLQPEEAASGISSIDPLLSTT